MGGGWRKVSLVPDDTSDGAAGVGHLALCPHSPGGPLLLRLYGWNLQLQRQFLSRSPKAPQQTKTIPRSARCTSSPARTTGAISASACGCNGSTCHPTLVRPLAGPRNVRVPGRNTLTSFSPVVLSAVKCTAHGHRNVAPSSAAVGFFQSYQ